MSGSTGLFVGLDPAQSVVALRLAAHIVQFGEGEFPIGSAARREALDLPEDAELDHLLASAVQRAGVLLAGAADAEVAA